MALSEREGGQRRPFTERAAMQETCHLETLHILFLNIITLQGNLVPIPYTTFIADVIASVKSLDGK